MPKTALDLTPEESRSYHPGGGRDDEPAADRWEKAWEVARAAARLLRENFGARRVVAFGPLAHRIWFGPWSDIDLAAWGIPADQFYRAVAGVTGITAEFEVNLVEPAESQPGLRQRIESEGIEL